ncbi:transglycosylase SLT domain-containing protein [Actibacterium pelagium]|uniref:Lytic transglycosylase n=1 Tax=Actibacterium pelagium TaxID=2029103 RepID=A0A917AFB4_9RHOB|nr:transglycosylase SLT domain-containing protein [Actibacterium pelagium]GGE47113.1 lytic transglycosylase [Actibacterium pelagium]
MFRYFAPIALVITSTLSACASSDADLDAATRSEVPAMRWDHLPDGDDWTGAAFTALETHGAVLPSLVPDDIQDYCPAYPDNDMEDRRAFWSGLASALAKHESTWQPDAVGGEGRWHGLLQISPGTARAYGCVARSGQALQDGPANLSCAVRIWASTVPRDGVVSSGMRGVAADWGPFHSRRKRQDIMEWTRAQDYCN